MVGIDADFFRNRIHNVLGGGRRNPNVETFGVQGFDEIFHGCVEACVGGLLGSSYILLSSQGGAGVELKGAPCEFSDFIRGVACLELDGPGIGWFV